MLDEAARLARPFPVDYCENRDCGAPLDRDAYELRDVDVQAEVVYCDVCAQSAVTFHPDRFKPVLPV